MEKFQLTAQRASQKNQPSIFVTRALALREFARAAMLDKSEQAEVNRAAMSPNYHWKMVVMAGPVGRLPA